MLGFVSESRERCEDLISESFWNVMKVDRSKIRVKSNVTILNRRPRSGVQALKLDSLSAGGPNRGLSAQGFEVERSR